MSVIQRPSAQAVAFSFTVVRAEPSRASLAATGELDLAAVDELTALIAEHEAAGRRFIRFDLSAVTFMDCSCLEVLIELHHRLLLRRGQLILTDISASVARLLCILGPTTDLLTTSEPETLWGGASA